ncbi:MAG: cation diffusion facilitator family transporter [bacterium]|nr:cation diffusion facilitator family transporter [bacterium]
MRVSESYAVARKAARLMLILNGVLCVTKLGVGGLGRSFALVADGLNNLTDIGVSIALYLGMQIARRPPDSEHAYGHGKFEQEISRLISIVVLCTGAGIIVAGVRRLPDVHSPPSLLVCVVAVFAIVVKIYMYQFQNRTAVRLGSSALAADALNHKADVAATACVLVGTGAIWVGGPAWASADDVAAIVVGTLMVLAAAYTIRTASSELLDRMPPEELLGNIRSLAKHFPGIVDVEQVMGRKTGMHYLIDIHLEVPGTMTVTEAHKLGHDVKDWVMASMPQIRDIIVHMEPTREDRT